MKEPDMKIEEAIVYALATSWQRTLCVPAL